jgi:hypothetical protein
MSNHDEHNREERMFAFRSYAVLLIFISVGPSSCSCNDGTNGTVDACAGSSGGRTCDGSEVDDCKNGRNELCETVVLGNGTNNKTIVMGYLMDQVGPPYRIGAISMAIQNGQKRGLLPGYSFR